MTPETAAALEASIEKWTKNALVDDLAYAKILSDSCPLCAIYFDSFDDEGEGCHGCPVSNRTGFSQCAVTPWGFAYRAQYLTRDLLAFRAAALKEVAFLESLREPKEGTP